MRLWRALLWQPAAIVCLKVAREVDGTKTHRHLIVKTGIVSMIESLSLLWTRSNNGEHLQMEPLSNQCSVHRSAYNSFDSYHNAGCSFFQNSCQSTCTSKQNFPAWRRRSYGVPERNELNAKELVRFYILPYWHLNISTCHKWLTQFNYNLRVLDHLCSKATSL
jgi:hypothetical protein